MKSANLPAVQDTTTPTVDEQGTDEPRDLTKYERDLELEEKLIQNLAIYKSPVEAARQAGYSEASAIRIKSTKLRNPKFLDKLKGYYKDSSTLRVLKIAEVEDNLVSYLTGLDGETIAKQLPSLRGTLRDIKAAAGVLADEGPEGAKTVNINNIKQLMVQVNND